MSKQKKKSPLRLLLQWVLVLACVYFIVSFFYENPEKIKQLAVLDWSDLVLIAGLFVSLHIIFGYRFYIVLQQCSGKVVEYFASTRIVVLGRFLSTFAPQSGNIYRGVMLKEKFGVSYTRYISSAIAFNWLDSCMNLMVALLLTLVLQPDLKLGELSVSTSATIRLSS